MFGMRCGTSAVLIVCTVTWIQCQNGPQIRCLQMWWDFVFISHVSVAIHFSQCSCAFDLLSGEVVGKSTDPNCACLCVNELTEDLDVRIFNTSTTVCASIQHK